MDAPAAAPGKSSAADATPSVPGPSTTPVSRGKADEAPVRTEVRKPVRAEIKKALSDGVTLVSRVVHRALTFGNDVEREAGVWLATGEQAAAIADPAASIVLDHVPAALLQTTFVNILRMVTALGGYANDHLDTKLQLRRTAGPVAQNPQTRPQTDVTGAINRAQ